MKPTNILFLVECLSATSLLFSSCFPYTAIPDPYIVNETRQEDNQFYVKSAPNIPLLTEKNDLSYSAMFSTNGEANGAEFQAAYMPQKKMGVTAAYSTINNSGKVKFNHYEFGSGYVTRLSKNWHFETYGGFGKSKIKNIHHTGQSALSLTHFFLQPTIAVSNARKTVQFAFASRFEGVNFKMKDTLFDHAREPINASRIQSLYQRPFHIQWQPGILFRFGWQNFLIQTGYSYSVDFTDPKTYDSKGNFTAGLIVRFNTSPKNRADSNQ